jgi:hypothetical protein
VDGQRFSVRDPAKRTLSINPDTEITMADAAASSHFVTVWVPIIAACGGAFVGAIGSGVASSAGPVVAQWLKERLFGNRENLLTFMDEQMNWYREREEKLNVFAFELSHDPPPDIYKRQVLVSQLHLNDRRGAMPFVANDGDIDKLREWAEYKAEECRNNSSQIARQAEQVNDKTLFRF